MSQCTNCFLDTSLHALLIGGRCPNCGAHQIESVPVVAPVGPGAPQALFANFGHTLKAIVFRPGEFFSTNAGRIVSREGLSSALAFAVIVQWLASFFNFVWRSTVGVILEGRMNDLMHIAGDVLQPRPGMIENLQSIRERVLEFLFGAGAIVLTPFTTLLKLALVTLFVHAAVRFFTKESADRPHSYSATLKIMAYSSAPWILCVIPGFGILLGYILSFMAAVIGIRDVYRTTTTRATLAVAFPELLFMVFVLGAMVFFLFLAFNVLRLVF